MNRCYNIFKNIQSPCITYFRNNYNYGRFLKDLPGTKCCVLSNGLTVATEERQCNNVCMGIYIAAGSRYENETLNGVTHFFEHLAFKGTKKRPKTALESDISKTGAKFSCFTTRDGTVYYVQCLSSEINLVADIFFDCIFNNALSDSEIELQKYTVYKEMIEYDKSSGKVLHDYLHSTAFQGTPLGQTVMGPSYNLYNMKASSISNYIDKMFVPERMVLVAVGGVKHTMMLTLGENYFTKTESESTKCRQSITTGPDRYTGSQVVYRDDSMGIGHIAIAVEGPCFKDNDKIVMELASSVLGGWDKSQPGGTNHGINIAHIASSGNLCESYKAFGYYYQDVGLWGVEFISSKEEVDNMLLTVQDEWMRLCYMITDGELIRAKNEMKSQLIRQLKTAVGACHNIGFSILRTGCPIDLSEKINSIDKITADDLQKVCNAYIYDRCPVVAGIGSTENLLSYPRIRSYMYWLRV
ncbi:cytochrome b-c1 complex subunit 1, mitochondrial-like [Vanessa cardui]|uniref:cytochrome b-c1 complex subunit 1, mitochondrial-like n=1 Tax=Vanessa cardui TaxID=171605 RepID=UPI001F12C2E7|nr:cytochrome b-c1 complex subunit 1, mitochondrial-like [Vanessa cardui]